MAGGTWCHTFAELLSSRCSGCRGQVILRRMDQLRRRLGEWLEATATGRISSVVLRMEAPAALTLLCYGL